MQAAQSPNLNHMVRLCGVNQSLQANKGTDDGQTFGHKVKDSPAPKTYKNEETENFNSHEGERKNPRKSAKQ